MNRIRGSVIVKIIAWVLLFSCGVAFIGSCVAVGIMEEYGIFREKKEDVTEREMADISDRYSAMVIQNYRNGQTEENKQYFEEKSFRYGLIEGETTEGLDLSDSDIYLESNFSDNIMPKELHMFSLELSQEDVIWYSDTLLGGYGYSIGSDAQKTLYADRICYDTEEGIFYYRAENKYYPVQNISLLLEIAEEDGTYRNEYISFIFDNNRRKYTNLYARESTQTFAEEDTAQVIQAEEIAIGEVTEAEETVSSQKTTQMSENVQIEKDSKEMQILQNNQEITFNMFDGTALEYTKWTELLFDNIRTLQGSELTIIDSKMIPQSSFAEVEDAYIDSYYTLHVYEKTDKKKYLVVSYLDKAVMETEKQQFLSTLSDNSPDKKLAAVILGEEADLYVRTVVMLDVLYQAKEKIVGFMMGTFLLAVVCFVFLLCAAGHRKKKEEIVLTFLDKIPLDILLTAVFFIELVAGSLMSGIAYMDSTILVIQLCANIGILMACVFMVTLLSFTVRVKAGKWWRNSVIYWIFAKVRGMLAGFWRNIGILWKVSLGVLLYSMLQLCVIGIIAPTNGDIIALLFFLEKLVLCPILFGVVLQFRRLQEGSRLIAEGDLQQKIDTTRMFGEFKKHADNLNRISEGMSHAVDERMKSERFKTELITNVSHDIKTPLTSIINYVDLLEKEDIPNEKAKEYLEVLERQAARLKKLIEDLIEASKASTGNLSVSMEELEANVFMTQILGEFEEKLANTGLDLVINKPEKEIPVRADGRHLWRVVDNLMNNICKYAQPASRVYINLEETGEKVLLTFRNMSRYPLNITSEELMERFVRGDSSRNAEGNGLGLSIAKSLMELMNGKLLLYVDGDLFKVVLEFPK